MYALFLHEMAKKVKCRTEADSETKDVRALLVLIALCKWCRATTPFLVSRVSLAPACGPFGVVLGHARRGDCDLQGYNKVLEQQ